MSLNNVLKPQSVSNSRGGVYILAGCLCAMPCAMYVAGINSGASWGQVFHTTNHMLWVGATFISALLVLTRLKIAWFTAIALLFATTLIIDLNFIDAPDFEVDRENSFQILFSFVNFIGMMAIAYFYKYPILDRRDTIILGIAERYTVSMSAVIRDSAGVKVSGQVTSASISGLRFQAEKGVHFDRTKDLFVTVPELGFTDVPAEFVSSRATDFRVKLKGLSFKKMLEMRAAIRKFPREK